jgi:uncharacterized membrane protein
LNLSADPGQYGLQTFIIIQSVVLVLWMILNVLAWSFRWDPYPFILLNLMLSFQAAFTGPVLLISQNRQTRFMERRHRLDLQINLLAEQESTETLRLLKLLCEKSGVPTKKLSKADQLVQDTRPETLAGQIIKSTELQSPHRPSSSSDSTKPPPPG